LLATRRDATFTLSALLDAGYHEEATAWRDWILRAVAAEPAKLQIMHRVDGSRDLGELLNVMELATRTGIPQSEHGRYIERGIVSNSKFA